MKLLKSLFINLSCLFIYINLNAQSPSIDLDANNSSGTTGNNYSAQNCKGSRSSIVDTDVIISSASNITSMVITIPNSAGNIKDGTSNEKLYIANLSLSDVFRTSGTGRLSVSGSGTRSITLTNSSNATIADFQNAVQMIKYYNSAVSPTLGTRNFTVRVNNNSGNVTATATLNLITCNDQCSPSAIINTSFEENTITGNAGKWQQFDLGQVLGWEHYQGLNAPNVGGGKIELQHLSLGYSSSQPDGTGQYAEIDREVNIQQKFASIPNQQYIIRFAIAQRKDAPAVNGSANRVVTLEFNDVVLDKIEVQASTANANWYYLTYYVTPTTTTSKIAFFADFNSTYGAFLDDFSVYAAGTFPTLVVHEPTSYDLTNPALTTGSDSGTGYTLSYHYTQNDANANVNPIANPSNIPTGAGTYYIRLSHYACARVAAVNFSTPLPIELSHFEAFLNKENMVQLNWTTASEINNAYFLVERSVNGKDWEYKEKILSKGNTKEQTSYYTLDENAERGINYYRLAQVDLDGTITYSSIVSVKVSIQDLDLKAYPNPTQGNLNITWNTEINEEISIRLINVLQKVVLNHKGTTEHTLSLENLPTGLYFLEVRFQANVITKKIIVQ
jgi:hypothetical protein